MLRSILRFLFFIALSAHSGFSMSQSGIEINGFCQNLVINGVDISSECSKKIQRFNFENGRINYWFITDNKKIIVFAGENEEGIKGANFFSRFVLDKIYVNEKEYIIDGSCSTLGNTSFGVTISCRSADNKRKFSALFFSQNDSRLIR